MSVKLLNEHHLEFLSLKGGSTGPSESTLVKMPHCWKPHAMALHMIQETSTISSGSSEGSDEPAIISSLEISIRISICTGCTRMFKLILNTRKPVFGAC